MCLFVCCFSDYKMNIIQFSSNSKRGCRFGQSSMSSNNTKTAKSSVVPQQPSWLRDWWWWWLKQHWSHAKPVYTHYIEMTTHKYQPGQSKHLLPLNTSWDPTAALRWSWTSASRAATPQGFQGRGQLSSRPRTNHKSFLWTTQNTHHWHLQ